MLLTFHLFGVGVGVVNREHVEVCGFSPSTRDQIEVKLGDNYHFPTEPPCWPQADTLEDGISGSWPPLVRRSSTQ